MTEFAQDSWSNGPASSAAADNSTRGHLAILDDESMFCEFLEHVGEMCGYETFATTQPDVFFDHLERQSTAAIILDLRMPGMDGTQVLRRLAEAKVRANIWVASGADARSLEMALRLGRSQGLNMKGLIQKPVDVDTLTRMLRQPAPLDEALNPNRLASAIAAGELELHYQPVLDFASGAIVAAEALVRWRHPRLGLLMPARFVPLAEQSGLIGRLTDWALGEAVRQAAAWRDAGMPLKIAVNVSNAGAPDMGLPERLEYLCAEVELSPSSITLELTESAAMRDPARAMEAFGRLRLKGFDLSIDDFGTGYSSLVQLQRLPFSTLKIDRSFVNSVISSETSASIVLAIIALSHALGMKCVAEGVEDAETLSFLKDNGCDAAQGYHIARPLPPAEIPALIESRRQAAQ